MELTAESLFRPYNQEFPTLFKNEGKRLRKALGKGIVLEHIGSTSIINMPGKGVIDMCLSLPKEKWPKAKTILSKLSYTYSPQNKKRELDRLFFRANLPDKELGTRLYHIHLTHPDSQFLMASLAFCNYIRSSPIEAKRYIGIKKKATFESQKFKTNNKMKETYINVKAPFIEEVLLKLGFKKLPD